MDGVRAHMKKHAEIIAPKFDAVLKAFNEELGGKGIAEWTNPNGGYFISLNVMNGCAKRTVELCREAGVVLTPAGRHLSLRKGSRRFKHSYRADLPAR